MNPNQSNQRTIKIELSGDMFRRKTFPKIRLQGQWLQRLGFKPTGRVQIIPIGTGEVILRYVDEQAASNQFQLNESKAPPYHNPS